MEGIFGDISVAGVTLMITLTTQFIKSIKAWDGWKAFVLNFVSALFWAGCYNVLSAFLYWREIGFEPEVLDILLLAYQSLYHAVMYFFAAIGVYKSAQYLKDVLTNGNR